MKVSENNIMKFFMIKLTLNKIFPVNIIFLVYFYCATRKSVTIRIIIKFNLRIIIKVYISTPIGLLNALSQEIFQLGVNEKPETIQNLTSLILAFSAVILCLLIHLTNTQLIFIIVFVCAHVYVQQLPSKILRIIILIEQNQT